MNMKRLVVFNQHTSFITIDIVNAFVERKEYDEIVLMAGVINEREIKLHSSVKIIKTSPYRKENLRARLMSWMSAFLKFLWIVTFRYRSCDVFMVSNPPLISFFPYFSRKKYSVLIFDVYPDALYAGGFVSERSLLYKVWVRANRLFYRRAMRIYTISEGMRNRISRYVDSARIEVVSLWSSFNPEIIERDKNIFIKEHGLTGRFVIMYSGNMGKGCGLEAIVESAKRLSGYKEIIFLFVGDGWSEVMLRQLVDKYGLKNCLFLPYQKASILRYSLSAADIAVISLPGATGSISIPNKLYTLMALGRPLLCLTPENTDLYDIVVKNNVGKCFESQDIDGMTEYILKMKNDIKYRQAINRNAIKASLLFTNANAKKIKINNV